MTRKLNPEQMAALRSIAGDVYDEESEPLALAYLAIDIVEMIRRDEPEASCEALAADEALGDLAGVLDVIAAQEADND